MARWARWCVLPLLAAAAVSCQPRLERHEPACEKKGVDRECFCDGGLGHAECFGPGQSGPCTCDQETPDIVQLATSGDHSCVVLRDGRVACWGRNDNGELGDGTHASRTQPALVPGLRDVRAIALAGGPPYGFSCALVKGGTVTCFGRNTDGELGNGGAALETGTTLVQARVKGIRALRADTLHACAIDDQDAVQCWGLDANGQLGLRSLAQVSSPEPARVPDLPPALALDAGWQHTCVVLRDGGVRCFGLGTRGQLGDGKSESDSHARSVSGVSDALEVQAGYEHSCVLTRAGAVKCFGRNDKGQLGDGTHSDRATPVSVQGLPNEPRIVQLALGRQHGCALDEDGDVYCWGDNERGQLGDGTTKSRTRAQPIATLHHVEEIAAGGLVTCARNASGVVYCFGDNASGQLGDGTRATRHDPTRVVFPPLGPTPSLN
ncbi:MAG TPA: hypothetical protein VHM19_18080 [Polyangiales bacterium]|jgi:hypothetical protein|nr:hypothetical protein [Polyangiales bacterium]